MRQMCRSGIRRAYLDTAVIEQQHLDTAPPADTCRMSFGPRSHAGRNSAVEISWTALGLTCCSWCAAENRGSFAIETHHMEAEQLLFGPGKGATECLR